MLRRRVVPLALPALLAVGLVPALAHAGGFYVPEIGPRAVGMAGAQVAAVDDTTAIFHNPAGLAGQPGTNVQVAGNLFFGNVEFFRRPIELPSGERLRFAPVRNTNRVGGAPYVGVTSDLGVRNLALGVAVYVPFGAHLAYPERGAQRHIVTEVELRTIYVTPTIAYRIADRFSLGVGLSYVYADLALDQANAVAFVLGDPEVSPDPDASIEGRTSLRGKDTASFSATFGLRWDDPEDRFAIGASVLLPTRLEFRGDATVRNGEIAAVDDPETGRALPDGRRTDRFAVEYPLPLVARIGASVRPHPRALLTLDYNYQRWSTFDRLRVDFASNYPLQYTPGAVMYDVVVEQRWSDSHSVRLATEFFPADPIRVPLRLRLGALYDTSPIGTRYFDVLAPDSDKLGISVGIGYEAALGRRARLSADIGFMHLFFRERRVLPGSAQPNGNPDDDGPTDPGAEEVPGSDKTILNRPAPSFYHGVTRTFFDILGLGIALRV